MRRITSLYRSETSAGVFARIGGDIGETAYVDSGLDANTLYEYELEACNDNGCSARSAAVSATTALGAPTSGLTATAQSASEISISWSAVVDATHYKLYRSATGAGSFDQIGGDIGATLHVDSGLDANTSYEYELESCNGNGCSGRSAAVSATTALGRPTAGLTATAQSASEISISWSAVADAAHYKLYRSAVGVGVFARIGDDIIGATDYIDDDGLEANTSYDYELEACNDNGCSGRSAAFSATTALGRPTAGLSATAQSASEISLSWSAVADATHYQLYRSAGGGSFEQIGGEIGETAYGDSGLDANTLYEYELEACNDNGCSARSAAFSATTALGMPTAGLTATAQSASEISLSWSAVADATHYQLYRSAGGGSFEQIGGEIGETAYGDSGLDANTLYEYELEACNDNGCSARSAAFSATTALGRPTSGLTATAQSASEISLSWSAVADATHYKLYRSDADAGSFEQVGDDIGETDYVDNNGLEANTSYDYELEACNGNGCSARSAAFSATTALGMPTAGLTATAQSASEISLSWSAVADATHYQLYRSAGGGSLEQIGGEIGETAYGDSGLDANTLYEYELEACNDNGCSARSAAVSATTALGRPTAGLTATAQSASEISLSWSAVADATHYQLYRSAAGRGSLEQIGGEIGETAYGDSGLDANTLYEYELEACNDNGCSARSAAVSATTALGRPTAGLTATAQSASEISLSWSAVADATHYQLYRSAAGGGSFEQIGGEIGETAYGDSGLDANTSYEYRLEACNDNGCSARSAVFSATTALGMPTSGLTATAQSASEISLSWSAVADATHYQLYRSAAGGGSFEQIGGEIGETAYGDSGLDANTSYEYRLEACNDNGCSARSAVFSATTALGRPTAGLTATAQSASEISLSWSAVADATHYQLYRAERSVGSFDQIGGEIGETAYGDSGLDANTLYEYELEACNDNGCSARSAAVSATTALGKPTAGLTATAQSASEVSLSWSAVADATHYQLYRSAGGGSLEQIGGEIGETAYGDSGLEANTSYDYELEACNDNGCSARSAAFSATTALGKPTAGLTATAQSASEISLSWSAVVDATHYQLYRSAGGGSLEQIGGEIGETAYGDSGLDANTLYEYELEACNGNGCSARSAAFSATTALGRPTAGLTATAQSASEISLSWSAVADATHYQLYRSAGGGSLEQIGGEIGETAYGDSGLDANTLYEYELEACNGNGCSARSAVFSATTALGMPTSGLTATAQSASEISLSWSAVVDATHYQLYRSAGGGSLEQIGGEIGETAYGDSGLDANTLYEYELEACNNNGCSARSAAVSATTALGMPTAGLTATAQSASEVSLSWSAVADATHYQLYRSAGGGSLEQVGGEIGETAYGDSGLDANTSYDYELEACNGNGCSARSAVFSATTTPTMPLKPTAMSQSASEISIAWSAVAGAAHYNLYRATVSGGSYTQIGGDISATDYLDSGLSVKTAYYYRLEACNSGGCSERSLKVLVETCGSLGAGRDETGGLPQPRALAFSGGRAYVADSVLDKIISYPVGAGGELGAGRDEITTGLSAPSAIAFSGGRAYVVDDFLQKIISYPVGTDGRLGAGRDEITTGLNSPRAPAFSGGRAYVVDGGAFFFSPTKIISYPVGAGGELGAGRDEITTGLSSPTALSFSGGRAYVADFGTLNNESKIISYPVGASGELGAGRDEITTGLSGPAAISFSGGRAYVLDGGKIISYLVETGGELVAGRDEITTGLSSPTALSFSGGRAYVVDTGTPSSPAKIISYPVGAGGELGAGRNEITADLFFPRALAFSDGRAYVADTDRFGNESKIISYPVGAGGELGAGRNEITTGLSNPVAIAFSGGRAYVEDFNRHKIISYPVGVGGRLGAGRDEITTGLDFPFALAFSGGRAYAVDFNRDKIISYPVGADGRLGAGRDEITTGLGQPVDIVFSGERAYVADEALDKIISYAMGVDGVLGEARDEITTGLAAPRALAFSGGRAYVADAVLNKIISYPVGAGGELGAGCDEITGLRDPIALAFSGGRAYVTDQTLKKIISYPLFSSVAFAVAPDAPRVVAQSDSEIEIAWNAVLGATHYKLYRSEISGGMYDQIGGDISITRYLNEDLSANTSYYYQLEACSGGECSGRSPKVSATTAPLPPLAPTAMSQSASEISIAWSAVAGAAHYNLYRATVSGGSYTQIGGDISATDYLDSGLSVKTAYYYRLEACNSGGCSERSLEVLVETCGSLGAGRDETGGLPRPRALAFSGGRAYVADVVLNKIISYPVGAGGELGAERDEITADLLSPSALAFSGGRAYVADAGLNKIISYPVGTDGRLGAGRDEITTGLNSPRALAFSGGRAYVVDGGAFFFSPTKIISYPVEMGGELGAGRNEITTGLSGPAALAFSGGRAYVADIDIFGDEYKIISYAVGADGVLGAERDEITTGLFNPSALAFSGGRAYVADASLDKIISYAVGADGVLGAERDEITTGLFNPSALAFSGGRAYMVDTGASSSPAKIISYPVGAGGELGAGRDEITADLLSPFAIAFSSGRAYVADAGLNKIISYPVGADGRLGAERDEITTGLSNPFALAFSGGRAYVVDLFFRKIISYAVGVDGSLSEARDEITGLSFPRGIAFSGGRAYVTDAILDKIISYPVGAGGELGAGRDEITGFDGPYALAFSGGRAYVTDNNIRDKIISYAVGVGGSLSAGRDEITTGLRDPRALAFSGGRAYVADSVRNSGRNKIISYAVGAGGELGAGCDEITGLREPRALAFSGGRAYVADDGLDKIISYPLFSSVPFAVAPDAPRVVAQSESEIEIAWNAVLGATHYKLYRSETSGGTHTLIDGEISVTRYLNEDLSADTSYYYQLEACNGDECSGRSPEVSATTDASDSSDSSGSRGAASVDDADDAVAKRQRDSDPIESSSEACNGDECSQRSPEVLTATLSAGEGVFHASGWVVGLDYQYGDGETGKTGEKGAFPLRSGQTVVFSTGQVTLGAVSIAADANADFFTPTRLGDQARAIRIERLLIALDSDGENDNGAVSLNAESASDALTAWNAARASDDETATPINGRMRAIPSAATAATLLKRANNCAFSGAFAGRWTDADGNGGEHAMVLLAFNESDIDGVSNPRGVFAGIDQITGRNSRNGKALWIKLWNQGGGLQSAVTKYGAASGALSIDLSAFPVVATMTASNGVVMTITVESYGKIGYAVGGESGVLNRVRQEIPNADYRLAGFYSNDDRATPPGEQKPEIGIFAASIDGESEKLEPYIGRFLTDGAGVYSNIGHSKQDAAYTRQGTPADGTITIVAADGREIELRFTEQRDGVGYGAYEDTDANGDDGFDVFGGWCKL